jgi:hypothetical protein
MGKNSQNPSLSTGLLMEGLTRLPGEINKSASVILDLQPDLYQEVETAGLVWFRAEAAGTDGRLKGSKITFRLVCVGR